MNLFRHLFANTPATPDQGVDWAYLGEVVAYPPHGVPSLPSDPCDETMPPNQEVRDVAP